MVLMISPFKVDFLVAKVLALHARRKAGLTMAEFLLIRVLRVDDPLLAVT
jgi:hypothetical protein